jgi:outer membrane protein TolC
MKLFDVKPFDFPHHVPRNIAMKASKVGIFLLLAASLAGCGSVKPKPYTDSDIKTRVEQDRAAMYGGQEPLVAPLTFYDAAARALKYNLDYRLKLMESALAHSQYDVATWEMLPRLVAGAGLAARNNDSGGTSVGIQDRIISLRPSTSQERGRDLASLSFSWSVLDFGISYYRAQQKADQALMAEERRRKVAQDVLQDVRNAYWRALAAQHLMGDLDSLLVRIRGALDRARTVESKGLMPRSDALAYQRALLDAVDLLTQRRQELELSQAELTALISLPPGVRLQLAQMPEEAMPDVPTDMNALETLALTHRPEIMEEWYRKRVTASDIKQAKALLWPNVSLDAGTEYDSNKYLYNNRWSDAGLQVSWNLLKLLQLPSLNRTGKAQSAADDMRRMALSMAVLTQVRVGVQRYGLALQELSFANESMQVDSRLLDYNRAAAQTSYGSQLETIRAEARSLLSRYQREAAYSNAQAAWGRLYNSFGLDVLPQEIEKDDVKTIAAQIERTMTQYRQTALGAPAPVAMVSETSHAIH